MKAKVEALKGIELVEPVVTIRGALDDDSRNQIKDLAKALLG